MAELPDYYCGLCERLMPISHFPHTTGSTQGNYEQFMDGFRLGYPVSEDVETIVPAHTTAQFERGRTVGSAMRRPCTFSEAVGMGAMLSVDAWDYGSGLPYVLWTENHECYLQWKSQQAESEEPS